MFSKKTIPKQQDAFKDKMLEIAISVLAESPSLNTEPNKNFIMNNKSQAHTFIRIIGTFLEASPKLDTQQNFDLLTTNVEHLRKIADIFCGLISELQTQENFTSLLQCTDFLNKIQNIIDARLPWAGGANPNPPLDQQIFNEMIDEIKRENAIRNFSR
jgi:hypothetical protein